MELTCVIIDDEKVCRDNLKMKLSSSCPVLKIIGEAASIEAAWKLLQTIDPDLVFLDIQLQDGTGFDLLERIPNRTFQVIFVTAFNIFAIRAFELNALDYLLKPIQQKQLQLLNQKISWFQNVFRITTGSSEEYLQNRKEVFEQLRDETPPEQLVIMHSKGMKIIRFENIIYLEASGSYTIIHQVGNERFTACRGLRSFEKLLDADKFSRIHKSTIINVDHFQEYVFKDKGYALLSNGVQREVSRRKKQSLLEHIKTRNIVI